MNALQKKTYERLLNETTELSNSIDWQNEELYANFLAQTYYFVCHSTRLLARSISYFPIEREDLYSRFVEHLKEENFHDKMIINDLKALNRSIETFSQLPSTQSFWECQYYKIETSAGISLLGYILYLEAIAVHCSEKMYQRLSSRYDPKSCVFMKVHTSEDPKHLEYAIDLISSLPLNEQTVVWSNFQQSAAGYKAILNEIKKKLHSNSLVA